MNALTQQPRFISFDGLDGVGKSTQIKLLRDLLVERGCDVVLCRDPGSTPLGEQLRQIVLHSGDETSICQLSEMLLYMAARAQLVEEVIRPAIAAGKVVVSDRFLLANVVYQGHAGGLDVESLWQVGRVATGGLSPDVTFLLDMPPSASHTRLQRPLDRIEKRGEEFRKRLLPDLAEAARDDKVVVIDAGRSIEEVHAKLSAACERVSVGLKNSFPCRDSSFYIMNVPWITRASHWDFMLSVPNATRLGVESPPHEIVGEGSIARERLPDHRMEYLDYEGPVSGGRGEVTRYDRGEFELLRQDEATLVVKLRGSKLRGEWRLSQSPSGLTTQWLLSRS